VINLALRDYVIQRGIISIALLFIVIFIDFAIFRLMPIDPLSLMGASRLPAEQIEFLKHHYGFDKPIIEQFLLYVVRVFQGDWGFSFYSRRPVFVEIGERVWNTVILVGVSQLIAGFIGLFIGLSIASKDKAKSGKALLTGSIILYSLPVFWTGLLFVIVLALRVGLFPWSGTTSQPPPTEPLKYLLDYAYHLVLPATAIVLNSFAGAAIMVRGSALYEFQQDYVVLARAKGASNFSVLYSHVLKNAMLPMITYTALTFGFILTGTILVEIVFSLNGLGKLLFNAVITVDYPVLQSMFFVIGLMVVSANLLADMVYGFVDPRIKIG